MTPSKMASGLLLASILPLALAILAPQSQASFADPFKLEVEQQGMAEQYGYPSPQMVGAPLQGGTSAYGQGAMQPMMGRASMMPPVQSRPPMHAAVQVSLPPQFLGAWSVRGQRSEVQALPEFQAGAEQAFAMSTSNIWRIGGSPQSGYSMSNNMGVNTQLIVDKVEGNTAFIRYQHPVGNTMAQEAIVMQLGPGGVQFQGLERVSIVKQGVSRARVTYQLMGQRQH